MKKYYSRVLEILNHSPYDPKRILVERMIDAGRRTASFRSSGQEFPLPSKFLREFWRITGRAKR